MAAGPGSPRPTRALELPAYPGAEPLDPSRVVAGPEWLGHPPFIVLSSGERSALLLPLDSDGRGRQYAFGGGDLEFVPQAAVTAWTLRVGERVGI